MAAQLPPVDENVRVPEAVKRASEAADNYYTQQTPPETTPPAAETPLAETPLAETPPAETPAAEPSHASMAQPSHDEIAQPSKDELRDSEWARRYNSMKGRYEASERTIGNLQDQVTALGNELMMVHSLLKNNGNPPHRVPAQPGQDAPQPLVTDQDRQTFGDDLLDVVTRAARQAISPELENLRRENNQVRQTVAQTNIKGVYATLDQRIPDWRAINMSPEFKRWLLLPDIYSGVPKQQMLNAAFQAADAPRVVAFFQGFLNEAAPASGASPAPSPAEPPSAPRKPAVALESLAAPGRARPATGSQPNTAASSAPVFTRAQIAQFYDRVRTGYFNGRETEKNQLEQAIFAAQRDGRVR